MSDVKILKAVPKNEKILEKYDNKYVVTRDKNGKYKLYMIEGDGFVFLKTKSDALFKETRKGE